MMRIAERSESKQELRWWRWWKDATIEVENRLISLKDATTGYGGSG
jgi:hypothetical protein